MENEKKDNFQKENELNKKIEIVEENLNVNKVREEVGEVVVEKSFDEVEENVDVSLTNEKISIERVKIGKEIAQYPQQREEDGKLIIPIVREKLVVVKQLILEEEIHISKEISEEIKNVKGTVRKDKINISRK